MNKNLKLVLTVVVCGAVVALAYYFLIKKRHHIIPPPLPPHHPHQHGLLSYVQYVHNIEHQWMAMFKELVQQLESSGVSKNIIEQDGLIQAVGDATLALSQLDQVLQTKGALEEEKVAYARRAIDRLNVAGGRPWDDYSDPMIDAYIKLNNKLVQDIENTVGHSRSVASRINNYCQCHPY